jgi:hypothetical protein
MAAAGGGGLDASSLVLIGPLQQGATPWSQHGPRPVAQERIVQAAAVLGVRELVTGWSWPPEVEDALFAAAEGNGRVSDPKDGPRKT